MMLGMEEIMCEVERDDEEGGSGLPPGFRFHPTDEELITFYLASKVFNGNFCGVHIAEVDLNRCEPWELPDVAKMGEREWYFFSLRDRKYPTGLRTNRATGAGYWKATGKDRQVYSASSGALLGMKKTLVFYRGRAPRGQKTKWVMHEYRLEGDFSCRHTGKEEWVICRIFHKMGEKKSPTIMVHDHQGQNNLLIKASAYPTTTNSLPPLLEPPPTLLESQSQSHQDHLTLNQNQTTFLINHSTQESHLKSLIDPLVSRSDFLPANLSFTNSVANQDSAILLKPLLSHQDFTFKELSNSIARQCKRESNLDLDHDHDQSRHFHLLSDGFGNDRWAAGERIQENCNKYDQIQNQNQNQLLFGTLGGGEMGLIPSPTFAGIDHVDHVMSTEPAFRWW